MRALATTRLGENELHGAHRDRSFLAIDELPTDDALALIESYQPDGRFRSEAERDAAREIARLLGCFTLAVEFAAVYLGQFANDVTCAAFRQESRSYGFDMRNGIPHHAQRGYNVTRPTTKYECVTA